MFVDTSVRPQGEQVDAIAPSRMKLSAAIKKGSEVCLTVGPVWATCAIGAAHFALTGRRFERDEWNGLELGRMAEQWAERFGYDPKIARRVQSAHDIGGGIQAALDYLESLGL